MRRARPTALLLSLCVAAPGALAQDAAPEEADDDGALAPVVVRGSRAGADRWQSPASMDVVNADDLKAGRPQISLSESLARVPGLVVRERQNFAQDAQLSCAALAAAPVLACAASNCTWTASRPARPTARARPATSP